MDADETRRVNESAGAEDGAARVYKTLVKKDRISALKNVTEKVREEHYKVTLPWDDKGIRLLPIAQFESYRETMDKLFEERNSIITDFMAGYQDAITEAQTALGSLFNEDDYPSEIDVKRRMVAEYEFTPVPDGRHFIANVSAEEADKIKRQIQKFTEKRIKGAISDIYRRLSEAIGTLGRQVNPDDEGTRVFASVLESLQEICLLGPDLNITDDPALAKLIEQTRLAIAGVEVDMLRPKSKKFSPTVRERLSDDLGALNEKFAGYFGGQEAS